MVEPIFRVSWDWATTAAPAGEADPAGADPMNHPATVATDLVNAVGEGIDNAASPERLATAAALSHGTGHHGSECGRGTGVLGADNRCQQGRPRRG